MRPGKIAPAWTAAEAADRIRERFNEKVTGVEPCFPPVGGGKPTCFAVGVEDARGVAGVRIVERMNYARAADAAPSTAAFPRSQMRPLMAGGSPIQTAFPTIQPSGTDPAPFRFRMPAPAIPVPSRVPEVDGDSVRRVLAALAELDNALTGMDVRFAASILPQFDHDVRAFLDDRQKAQRQAAEAELERLTGECRAALERVGAAQDALNSLRDDQRRARQAHHQARGVLTRVRASRPKDSAFPTREELSAWQERQREAQTKVAGCEGPVEELRESINSATLTLSRAKNELAALTTQRKAVQEALGIHTGESSDVEEESLVLRA